MWSTPDVVGDIPPPCVDFSFLSIDDHRAVVFGGFQPDKGAVSETYILNMEKWVRVKLTIEVDNNAVFIGSSLT